MMNKLSKQNQECLSETKGDIASCKLDPGSLASETANSSVHCRGIMDAQSRMTLRRRGKSHISEPMSCNYAAPLKQTYLPKVDEDLSDVQASRDMEQLADKESDNKQERREKIFSISKSVVHNVALMSFAILFCLFTINRVTLLVVTAQYSNQASAKVGPAGQHQAGSRSQVSRQLEANQPLNYLAQAGGSLKNGREAQLEGSQNKLASSEDRRDRANRNSIDRFDSGEQIRPPLLRQPTTLPPLPKAQQASINNGFNLQAAASQDSYLSPEDREQLLRSQESHYEGKNVDQANGLSPSASERDRYERPDSWNGLVDSGSNEPIAPPPKSANLESHQLRPEASASNANNDADDTDDEDENVEPEQKRANLVPERRRMAANQAASFNRHYSRPAVDAGPSLSEEGDSNDDYGSANDDAYFSRKSNQDRAPLNLAASHNQQNRNMHSSYANAAHAGYNMNAGHPNGDGSRGEEQQGFGPGPNEAYMVERAESGNKHRTEPDDDALYPTAAVGSGGGGGGGSDADAPSANDEDDRFDRRSMNEPSPSSNNNLPYASPIKYTKSSNQMVGSGPEMGDPDSDPEDGGEGAEESGPSYAANSNAIAELKSRAAPSTINQRLSNVIPKTAASAPAPSSALSPLALQASRPTSLGAPTLVQAQRTPRPGQAVNQRHQQALGASQQGRPMDRATGIGGANAHSQPRSANAPYNPQDNPSHAGKYFIN